MRATTSSAAGGALQQLTPRAAERPAQIAEARVRALRDAVRDATARLQPGGQVSLREMHDDLWAVCSAIEPGDLGADGTTIGQQFEAFFERLRGLVAEHVETVPTDSLGLAADARFLNDMGEYLTRNYALDPED
jgi:hypothetical protein